MNDRQNIGSHGIVITFEKIVTILTFDNYTAYKS